MASRNRDFLNTSTHPNNAIFGSSTTTDTAGPHNSNIANKLDPRVDSDRDGRAGGLGATNTRYAGGFGSQHQPGATSTYGTSTNAGPHDSNIANKLDPRVDSDRDNRGAHHGHSENYGPHSTNIANKLDPRVDSDRDGRAAPHNTSTNAGPHSSNIANKLDPRVDSDRDNRGAQSTGGIFGSSSHTTSSNAGPHDSNIANKLDPRVDSDRDNRGAHHGQSENYGPHSTNIANKLDPRIDSDRDGRADPVVTGSGGPHSTSTNAGPHSSNIANKLDPRIDSDRDGRADPVLTGSGGPHSTSTANKLDPTVSSHDTGNTVHGTHGTTIGASAYDKDNKRSTNAGPHSTNIGNKLDPTVDSDRDHRGTNTLGRIPMVDDHGHSTASHARTTPLKDQKGNLPGPAPHTAGPHKSDILNKLDPRVDSDLDGSRTIGKKHY